MLVGGSEKVVVLACVVIDHHVGQHDALLAAAVEHQSIAAEAE
jgi:hypothetical protein